MPTDSRDAYFIRALNRRLCARNNSRHENRAVETEETARVVCATSKSAVYPTSERAIPRVSSYILTFSRRLFVLRVVTVNLLNIDLKTEL